MKKDYIFEDARIRVMETGLLTKADFEQLLAEPSYASALTFLTDKGWGGPDAPKNAEALLQAEEKATWDLMEELLPGMKFVMHPYLIPMTYCYVVRTLRVIERRSIQKQGV